MADWTTAFFFLSYQVIVTVLFALFTKYTPATDNLKWSETSETPKYSMFQDVHVMVFVGFGYMMAFLRRYGFSSTGFNFLFAASMLEWGILCEGLFGIYPIRLTLSSLVGADIIAAVCLISMGVVLGKTTPLQLLIMGLIEGILFKCNSHIVMDIFKVRDSGGSMTVHVFAAYFALGVGLILGAPRNKELYRSSYTSDMFGMLGCILLWAFWPSFTAIDCPTGFIQERAVINTYISLIAACIASFGFSALINRNNKFSMIHIQNGSLAGGVAIGSAVDLMVQPFGAAIVGFVGGIVTVMGFAYLQPWVERKLRLHDTCGVHNLHALPGIIGVIVSAIVFALYDADTFQNEITLNPLMNNISDRTPLTQAAYQMLGLSVSIVLPLVGGLVTGLLLRVLKPLSSVTDSFLFNDEQHWDVEEDEEAPQITRITKSDQESAVTNSFQIM